MDETNKKILFAVLIIAIIVTGLMSSYNLLITRGYSSKVYGTLGLNNFVKTINEEEFEFTFDKFEKNLNFIYTKSTDTKITDLSKYSLNFNGYNGTNEYASQNSLYADFNISFLNYQNKVIKNSSCKISLSLREETLTLVLSVEDYTSINLWEDYLTKNNIKIKLINKISLINIEETVIEDIQQITPPNDEVKMEDYICNVSITKTIFNNDYYGFTIDDYEYYSFNNEFLSIIDIPNVSFNFNENSIFEFYFNLNGKNTLAQYSSLTLSNDKYIYDYEISINKNGTHSYIVVEIIDNEIILYCWNIVNELTYFEIGVI